MGSKPIQIVSMLGGLMLGVGVWAQTPEKDSDAPAPPAQAEPAPEQTAKAKDAPKGEGDPLGDLDDLLGIPEEDRGGGVRPEEGQDLPADRSEQELERRLTGREISDQFEQAVAEMGEAAQRLARAGDAGIETQRLHKDILTKLDVLIKEAKNKSSSSGSSSSQKQSDNPQQAPPQPKQGQSNQNEAGEGENRGEVDPPAFESPELRRRIDLARAAWGSLPERIRKSLIEGLTGDTRSSLYDELTKEYYRRLAEDRDE